MEVVLVLGDIGSSSTWEVGESWRGHTRKPWRARGEDQDRKDGESGEHTTEFIGYYTDDCKQKVDVIGTVDIMHFTGPDPTP